MSFEGQGFGNAAATGTPAGTSCAACSAAEPAQTPSVCVAAPPILTARGTVVSIKMVPGFQYGLSCFSNAACPGNGTVRIAMSASAAAWEFSAPRIGTFRPPFAELLWAA